MRRPRTANFRSHGSSASEGQCWSLAFSGSARAEAGGGQQPQRRFPPRRAASQASTQASRKVRDTYRSTAKMDLDRNAVWECKTFCLFPLLVRLTSLDHIFRVAFPLAYGTYMLIVLSQVGFGTEHYKLLAGSPCYVE